MFVHFALSQACLSNRQSHIAANLSHVHYKHTGAHTQSIDRHRLHKGISTCGHLKSVLKEGTLRSSSLLLLPLSLPSFLPSLFPSFLPWLPSFLPSLAPKSPCGRGCRTLVWRPAAHPKIPKHFSSRLNS